MVYRKVPIYRKRWIVCTYTKSEPPCIIESGWLGFTNSPTTSSTGGWILPSKGAVLLLVPKGGVTSIVTGPLTKRYFLNPLSLILPPVLWYTFVLLLQWYYQLFLHNILSPKMLYPTYFAPPDVCHKADIVNIPLHFFFTKSLSCLPQWHFYCNLYKLRWCFLI